MALIYFLYITRTAHYDLCHSFLFQSGCKHVVLDTNNVFARLAHYCIHECSKSSSGKAQHTSSCGDSHDYSDGMVLRRRGRPPKYPRKTSPIIPKIDLTEQEILKSTQRSDDGEGVGTDKKIINGFRKFDTMDLCPDEECIYRNRLHYHCGHLRCYTSTDRVDVLNLHAKEFHKFVIIRKYFEYFDRYVNCRRTNCSNNRLNRHFHCTRPHCDYSFVRHSTMLQHEKKHLSETKISSSEVQTAPALARPSRYLITHHNVEVCPPVMPVLSTLATIKPAITEKNVVKATATFYPASCLYKGTSFVSPKFILCSLSTIGCNSSVLLSMSHQDSFELSSVLTSSAIKPMPSISSFANTDVSVVSSSLPHCSTLPFQSTFQNRHFFKSGAHEVSSLATKNSVFYNNQSHCGRPFCKLKKKDHYHCLDCNQAFSDASRLHGHVHRHILKPDKGSKMVANIATDSHYVLTSVNLSAAQQMGLDLSTKKGPFDFWMSQEIHLPSSTGCTESLSSTEHLLSVAVSNDVHLKESTISCKSKNVVKVSYNGDVRKDNYDFGHQFHCLMDACRPASGHLL